ncbi:hypothetical protein BHE74_00007870 [Ensete ventricosum]|nr:hypothetical protein BHE74_00007870 [Ensete ventricosum]
MLQRENQYVTTEALLSRAPSEAVRLEPPQPRAPWNELPPNFAISITACFPSPHPTSGILQLAPRIPEVTVEVFYLLLQLPTLSVELGELSLQSLYFGLKINDMSVGRWAKSLFQVSDLASKVGDLVAHTTNHPIMYLVNQRHGVVMILPKEQNNHNPKKKT